LILFFSTFTNKVRFFGELRAGLRLVVRHASLMRQSVLAAGTDQLPYFWKKRFNFFWVNSLQQKT
jgi:hypothetical protein